MREGCKCTHEGASHSVGPAAFFLIVGGNLLLDI